MDFIQKLKEHWGQENIPDSTNISDAEIRKFQEENKVVFPSDLIDYFKKANGSSEEYDNQLFRFSSLSNFKSIDDDLKNWNGVPDYSNIVNTLPDYKSFYVIGDYSFSMFAYAIKLLPIASSDNEIVVIAGDKYKKIANSFSEFIDLYLNDSTKLLM
jgi:hypothetical protein